MQLIGRPGVWSAGRDSVGGAAGVEARRAGERCRGDPFLEPGAAAGCWSLRAGRGWPEAGLTVLKAAMEAFGGLLEPLEAAGYLRLTALR